MAEPIALQFQPPRIDVPQFQFPDTVGTLVKAAQIQHALSQSQHAQAQSGLAQAQTQSYGLKNQQAQDEAKNERLARDAQYVKGFADDPDKYAAAWKGRLDDAVNRGDIPPLMHAQLSQQPPSKELLDSVIQRGAAIPSRLAEAHAGYYEEVAAARRQIAAAVEKNSDTKRLKAYGDVLQKFGPDPPTRDIWDRESQPGGFLHTAFGGRMVPYEQAPQAWREIKSRVAAGPDDQELAEAGLTPEQIRDARRQRVLQGVYGKIEPKTGKRWTPGGALEDIPERTPIPHHGAHWQGCRRQGIGLF